MEKTKITNYQIFTLTACFSCGTAILITASGIAGYAKQDAWISVLIAMLFSMFEIWIICFFWSRYPGMNYVEIIQKIFGKWIGGIVSAGFVIFCLQTVPQLSWYMSEFVTLHAIPERSSAYAIAGIFLGVATIALLYGLETITRAYEILMFIASFVFILAMTLVLPQAKIENLQPVFENGIIPILKGSIHLSAILIFPMIILLIVYPSNADNTKEAKISFLKGHLWGGFLLFISVIMSILILGSTVTSKTTYPVYLLAKEIDIGIIFSRLEFLIAATWIITLLSRQILWFYTGIIGLSQLLGLKDHKKIILPFALISLVFSQIVYPNINYESTWGKFVWLPFGATFGLVIPVLLIIVHFIKKWYAKSAL